MSTCSQRSMTNTHDFGVLSQIRETLHIWGERKRQRQELARWTDRDLHDIGRSRSEIIYETAKPFWRA
jgi:uncharacterized protein YjiS (DUF1127 family)